MKHLKYLLVVTLFAFLTLPNSTSAKQITLGGELSLNLPTGDFGDAYGTGFGITGVFTYRLNPNLAFTGSLGYISFGEKLSGLSFSTVPINAGIQYRITPTGNFQPYIGAETLLFMSTASVESGFFGKVSSSSTDFSFTPLVGAAFPINNNLEIRANLKYHILFTSGSSTTFIGIGGGLHFKI